MEQAPWQRMKQSGTEHYHAFILEPTAIRFCCVSQLKGGKLHGNCGIYYRRVKFFIKKCYRFAKCKWWSEGDEDFQGHPVRI